MLRHYNITISGQVQGVFFRHHANVRAQDLGLVGFVKNQVDGSVYLEVEGQKRVLKEFIDWCYQGSPNAQVNEVKIKTGQLKNFSKFEIKY